jgi:hypothetical protein
MSSLTVGEQFENVQTLRTFLADYAISENFELKIIKSDIKRYTAKCKMSECSWRIHASVLDSDDESIFAIKTLVNVHSCHGVSHLGHNQATAAWIAEKL